MRPSLPSAYGIKSFPVHAEFPSEGTKGIAQGHPCSDCYDLFGIELGASLSFTPSLSSLAVPVRHVVLRSSDKEVFGVAATWHVARVKNEFPLREPSAIGKLPSQAMSPNANTMRDSEHPVPFRRPCAKITSAARVVWHSNVCPEPLFESKIRVSHVTSSGSVVRDRSKADTLPGPVYFSASHRHSGSGY